MLAIQKRKIEKTIKCPKCGSDTKPRKLSRIWVNQCAGGCGIWINQTELDSQTQKSRSWLEPSIGERPVGLFRSRRLARN